MSEETKKLLDESKRERRVRSYDDVISSLIRPVTGIPRWIFGACRRSSSFSREGESEHEP